MFDYKFVLYDVNTMLIGETRRSGGLPGSILALKIFYLSGWVAKERGKE